MDKFVRHRRVLIGLATLSLLVLLIPVRIIALPAVMGLMLIEACEIGLVRWLLGSLHSWHLRTGSYGIASCSSTRWASRLRSVSSRTRRNLSRSTGYRRGVPGTVADLANALVTLMPLVMLVLAVVPLVITFRALPSDRILLGTAWAIALVTPFALSVPIGALSDRAGNAGMDAVALFVMPLAAFFVWAFILLGLYLLPESADKQSEASRAGAWQAHRAGAANAILMSASERSSYATR